MQKTSRPCAPRHHRTLAVTLLTAMLAATQSSHATTYTWNTGTSGALWSASGSWVGAAVPTFVAGDTFDLSTLNIGAATASSMDTVGGNTLGTIKIGDTNNTHSWTLALSTALTLDGNGSAASINQVSTSKGDTINGAGGIILASDLNTTNDSGNVLNISTGITATGGTRTITNNGSGGQRVNLNGAIGSGINLVQNSTTSATWMLGASASFNGTITVKAGNFEVGATGANGISLGTAAFTLGDTSGSSDATLVFKSGNGSGYSAPITVASGSTGIKSIVGVVQNGNNAFSFSGAITLGPDSSHTADLTIGTSAGGTTPTYNVTGGVTGFGNLTVKNTNTGKTVFGTTSVNNTGTITNASTGSGLVQFNSAVGANVTGIVQNSSTSQMNLNAANTSFVGNVTVLAGTLALTGSGSINNSSGISVATGATFNNSSSVAVTTGLTLAEGSALAGAGSFTPGSTTMTANLVDGFSAISAVSGLTKAGTLTFNLTNITEGSYSLFSGGTPTGSFIGVSIASTSLNTSDGNATFGGNDGTWSYLFDNSSNNLTISAIPEPSTYAALAGVLALGAVVQRRRRNRQA